VLDCRQEWQAYFDSILLLDTLEHISAPTRFLEALHDHLTPGGTLILNVPAMPVLYSRYDSAQGHVKRYTLATLEGELCGGGFELLGYRRWGANLVPLALLRKFLVSCASPEKAMHRGFAPAGAAAEQLLRGCWALERRGYRLPGCGTSLAAIARRRV
jgi:hypothetical protein